MELDFLEEVHQIPGGEKIVSCIQCGTCSGSCPVNWAMEESPRQLFAMIRAGMRDRVLDSTTIWTCSSCYSCTVRCPQQIKITDIMYVLKRMAMQEHRGPALAAKTLARLFVNLVDRNGRNHEPSLLMRYLLSTRPIGIFREAPIGWKLVTRGRMPLKRDRIKNIEGFRKIVAKAHEMGGE
jgi:heterodisulfide reductase subunit C